MSDSQSSDDAVPWHELPHNPVAFFGLTEGFDQKDLKRAYNRLIRKFKPENAPAEFQRIRAAYERLDNQLRYGGGFPGGSIPQASDWNQIFSVIQSGQSSSSGRSSPDASHEPDGTDLNRQQDYLSTLLNEIRSSTPAVVLERLSQKADTTSFEYYVMAVLSDTQPGRSTENFVRHILAGLDANPRDPCLNGILYTLFRQPLSEFEIPAILVRTAKVVRSDAFYSLTEPLWGMLVRSSAFEKVRDLLSKCESMLRDFRIEGKLAFHLHLLRISLFRADREWIRETFAFLEDNHSSLNPIAEHELDRLQSAWAYLQHRKANPPRGELQKRMDKAIEDYFSGPEETREHGVVECQTRIATSIDDVTNAFPFDINDEEFSPFLQLWFSVSADLAWRPRNLKRDAAETDRRVIWFMATLQTQTDRSRYGRIWDLLSILIHTYAAAGLVAFATIALSILVLRSFIRSDIAVGISLFVGLSVALLAHIYLIKPWWSRCCQTMALRCYNVIWRREVLQFLGQSQLSSDEFFYKARDLRDPKLEYVTWTLNLMRRDDAIPLYSTAQMFLR